MPPSFPSNGDGKGAARRPYRLLVVGYSKWWEPGFLYALLDKIHEEHINLEIVHENSYLGAPYVAHVWCEERGVREAAFKKDITFYKMDREDPDQIQQILEYGIDECVVLINTQNRHTRPVHAVHPKLRAALTQAGVPFQQFWKDKFEYHREYARARQERQELAAAGKPFRLPHSKRLVMKGDLWHIKW